MHRLCVISAAVTLILLCWTDSADGRYSFHKKWRKHKHGRGTFYSRTNQGAGRAECSPDSPPQIPNVLQPVKLDPYRMLGRWYNYIRYYNGIEDDTTSSTNAILTFNALALDTLQPATGSPAVLVEQLYSRWNLTSGQCVTPSAYLSYLTPEGTLSAFGTVDPTYYVVDNSVILATDYNYAILYECIIYNAASGFCDDPFFYIFTRVRPDKVLPMTIETISRAVNRLLSQYCLTVDMFIARLWTSDIDDCPLLVPDDPCYQALRQAHLDLAGVSA